MKNLLYIYLSVFILIAACKKKDDPEPEPEPAVTTGSTTGGPAVINPVSAILSVTSSTYEAPGMGVLEGISARAYFTSTPQTYEATATGIRAGTAALNGDSLPFITQVNYYNGMLNAVPNTINWTVSGANGIPAMNLNHPGGFPASSDLWAIPDTLLLSNDVTIQLTDVANMNFGQLVLVRKDGSTNGLIVRNLKTGNNTFVITSAQLKAFGVNELMYSVTLENKTEVDVQGKKVRLSTQKTALKYITLKN